MSAIDDSGDNATINPFTGLTQDVKATPIDQIIDPKTGLRTTYWSDGNSTTDPLDTITQGATNVQSSPDFATQIKNLFSGNSSLGTVGQIGSIAGLLGLLSSMGGSSNTYAGYKGGIPSLTGVRQQYATPQVQTGVYAPNLPANAAPNPNTITKDQLNSYLNSGSINDAQIANQMNRYGITPANLSGITGIDQSAIQQRYNQTMGPNAQLGAYRPGQGGITYFSPMKYIAPPTVTPAPTTTDTTAPVTVAHGGLLNSYNTGGITSLGGYSDGGQLLRGPGDGVSDSIPAVIGERQPARLADGEFVVPARIVSELGNGSTESGARKLYGMMDRIKKSRAKAKNIAADTKSDKYLPA